MSPAEKGENSFLTTRKGERWMIQKKTDLAKGLRIQDVCGRLALVPRQMHWQENGSQRKKILSLATMRKDPVLRVESLSP